MNKVAFFSVVYPGVESFLDDFFKSLMIQSFKNFDLIIINDGLHNLDVFISKYSDLHIKIISFTDVIPKIREYGMNYLIANKYDIIIFGDSDDYFNLNRVETSVELLKRYDIVVNDLSLVKNNEVFCKNYISSRCSNMQEIDYNFIENKNIFGFTNTAIRAQIIKQMSFNKNIKAVDWFFFSTLLYNDISAVFTNNTTTFYRQHSSNIAGINKVNSTNLIPHLEVKINHYTEMQKTDQKYTNLCESYKDSLSQVLNNKDYFHSYLVTLQSQEPKHHLWWENIKSVKEL